MDRQDLQPYQIAFAKYIEQEALNQREPETLYDPIHYILSLGGKRIRPILTLLSAGLFTENWQLALPQAMAIEAFHNFSLMHDDIMDQAPTRRGSPSVHLRYDVNAAILSGDALLVLSYDYLIRGVDPGAIPSAVKMFTDTSLGICKGQQYDMDFEKQWVVGVDEYLEMIRLKTAILLGLAMGLGGVVAGTSDTNIDALQRCGEGAGMAFQIHDDYLDAFGEAALTGKRRGGDILQNKKTFLWLKAYELGGQRVQDELRSWSENQEADPDEKVSRVLDIYRSLDIESHCRAMQQSCTKEALDALEAIDARDDAKQQIFDLISLLLTRSN